MNTKPTWKDVDMQYYIMKMGLLFLLSVFILLLSFAIIK